MPAHIHFTFADNDEWEFERAGWSTDSSVFFRNLNFAVCSVFDLLKIPQNLSFECELRADSSIAGTMAGTFSLGERVGRMDEKDIFEPSVLSKIKSGSDIGAQRSGWDFYISFKPAKIHEELWLSPEPADFHLHPPSDKKDFASMVMHEMMHCLGVAGYRTLYGENCGQIASNSMTSFDGLTSFGEKSEPCFTGEESKRLFGAPLPLFFTEDVSSKFIASNFYHIDSSVAASILNPELSKGRKVSLQPIDFAILKDLGYEILGFGKCHHHSLLPF